jgi:hypothetical protein
MITACGQVVDSWGPTATGYCVESASRASNLGARIVSLSTTHHDSPLYSIAGMSLAFADIHVIAVTVIVFAGWIVFCSVRQYLCERKYRAQRPGWKRDDFVTYFSARDVPQEISAGVYDGLPRYQMIVGRFPVHPDDNLQALYGVGGEGGVPLCEFLDEIAPDCGVHLPAPAELSVRIKQCWPIITVADLVRLLSTLGCAGSARSCGPHDGGTEAK